MARPLQMRPHDEASPPPRHAPETSEVMLYSISIS